MNRGVVRYRLKRSVVFVGLKRLTIAYSIREPGHVTLGVYDVTGRLVRTLVSDVQSPRAGGYKIVWDGRSDAGVPVATGVYFYKLDARGFTQAKKMVLLK